MKDILKNVKKFKVAIITALLVIVIGSIILIIFNSHKSKIKNFTNEYYSFYYDNSWSIKNSTDNTISLKHKTGSSINIEVVDLKDEYKYSAINDILDEFLFSVEQQNESYKLLAKEECKVTKSEYDGFKLLYENGTSQALLYVCKISDKLIIFNFESDNSHFDILLDSVQNIVYNFNISSEKFDLSYKISVDTTDINYLENKELSDGINTIDYEIADNNYLVNYSIPEGFELSEFNSESNYFNYRGIEEGSIRLMANIYNKNIYEYLEKDKTIGTIYSDNDYIREGEDSTYSDFKEDLAKLSGDYEGYIYKSSYTYKGVMSDTNYEDIIIAYVLDENHLFIVDIEARNIPLPEEFINKITINSYNNYSSYVKRDVEDGNLVGTLKRLIDYDREKYDEITIKIPEKYTELDKGYNIYTDRFYALNYDENTDVWEYHVNYTLTTTSRDIADQVELQSSSYKTGYGESKALTYTGDITLNNKTFKVYDGMYTDITNTIFDRVKFSANVKILFYELDNGGYLVIEVIGNGCEISDEILNEVTNFDIEEKIYSRR